MRVFVTGATGYIGRVVTERAIAQGHDVNGLSRTQEGDARLKALGATPLRGDLASLSVLHQESAKADAVFQLAYIHNWGMDIEEILRIDSAPVDALSDPLRGTEKSFVITSETAVVEPDPAGRETTEDSPVTQTFALGKGRMRSERHALDKFQDHVRVSAIRLPAVE